MAIFQKTSVGRIRGQVQAKESKLGLDEKTFNHMFHIEKKIISREDRKYLRESNKFDQGPG